AVGLENIIPSGLNATDVFLKVNMTALTVLIISCRKGWTWTPGSVCSYISCNVDPKIHVTLNHDFTFILLAKGGVGAWTW
ncbi:hypothetical protein K439DRAFT_1244571, partial [Ramaria rubella]